MDVLKSGPRPRQNASVPALGKAHGQNKNPEAYASGTCWWLRPAFDPVTFSIFSRTLYQLSYRAKT